MSEQGEHVNETTKLSDKRLGIYALILLFFWLVVAVFTVHPILPANPIEIPFEEKSPLVNFLPQGWAFFTRDPKSLDLAAFVKNSGDWQPAPPTKRFWPHLLNFSRRWKIPGIEMGLLLNDLPDPQWQACRELPIDCLKRAPLAGTVENPLPQPSLCGEVGLIHQEPVPWAWREASEETVMPSEVLRLQVSCR